MQRSITQDLRLLPSTDEIAKRISADANSIVEKIQDRIIEQSKSSKDGKVEIDYEVPALYDSLVSKALRTWAGIQNYSLQYVRGKIVLAPKGFKFINNSVQICSDCKSIKINNRNTLKAIFFGFLGTGIGISIVPGIILNHIPAGFIGLFVVVFICGIIIGGIISNSPRPPKS